MAGQGLTRAVRTRDTATIINWLIEMSSFQGISDARAIDYLNAHDRADYSDITARLASVKCPKLSSYWAFEKCGYEKNWGTCSRPDLVAQCPLPQHDLRNGRLNQTAYAMALFARDLASSDIVGWIDDQLAKARRSEVETTAQHGAAPGYSLVAPLAHVYGVSDKILNMALSDFLIGTAGETDRPLWMDVGVTMVAVDSLVHNWLHRTGVANRWGVAHVYGSRCYQADGCRSVIEQVAANVDTRQFDLEFPQYFPRFVQRAIWSFCAADEHDRCNGNRIDDRVGCGDLSCPLVDLCDRLPIGRAI